MTNIVEELNITNEEKELVIHYVAQRYKDYVNVMAERIVRETLVSFVEDDIKGSDQLKLTFHLTQVVNDIFVELGHIRREKHDKKT